MEQHRVEISRLTEIIKENVSMKKLLEKLGA
jgi:hypothetical protein